MLNRFFNLSSETDSSIFLFGARQTGKTTILHQQFPDAIFFDLLNTSIKDRLRRRPVIRSVGWFRHHDSTISTSASPTIFYTEKNW